jgi:nitrate/nitrite transport system permease protein
MLSLLMVWQIATMPKPKTGMTSEQTEYAKLMGKIPDEYGNVKANNGMPTPNQFVDITINQLKDPFYDNGPNDKGIGIQLMHSGPCSDWFFTCGNGCDTCGFLDW